MNLNKVVIPYSRQYIDEDDRKAVLRVLKSDYLTQGPEVESFETKISAFCNVRYGVALNSATSALHASCNALGIGSEDTVWTVPTTFVASANCALYCNAQIDFVDINANTWCICPKKLEEKLKLHKSTNKSLPSLLIVVHLGGQSCDMEKIYKLSIQYSFKIIEDASHALGSFYKNKRVGSCQFSDVAVFSFHPVKTITCGEGGIAVTNSKKIANKIEDFRSHGIVKDQDRFLKPSDAPWYYEQQSLGFNYRLSDIHAALGASQLNKIEKFEIQRNIIRDKYIKELKDLVVFQTLPKECISANHLFIIRVPQSKHKSVFINLRNKGILVGLHYMPVHLNPFYKKLGFKEGLFPESEKYAKEAISLPLYPNLSDSSFSYIIKNLKINL